MSRFKVPPVFRVMNEYFDTEIVRAVITELDPELNFSRKSAPRDVLDASFGAVMDHLDVSRIAIPRVYQIEGAVVNLAIGHGYTGDNTNPNPSGMSLVLHEARTALAVTYADAPSALVVHPYTGVVAAVSGIWTALPKGTVNQTIVLMETLVEAQGQRFNTWDLWVNLSAGAREESFFIDDRGRNKLMGGLLPPICNRRILPVFDKERPYGLDLSGLFRDLWVEAGVPPKHIGFDARNTMTCHDETGRLVLPSKRTSETLGNPAYSSAVQAVVWTGSLPG